jgi:hypothetical protein
MDGNRHSTDLVRDRLESSRRAHQVGQIPDHISKFQLVFLGALRKSPARDGPGDDRKI